MLAPSPVPTRREIRPWLFLATPLLAAAASAQTFSAPEYVNDYAPLDDELISGVYVSNDQQPEIASQGTTMVAAWTASRLPGVHVNTQTEIAVARSTDGGASWSPSLWIKDDIAALDLEPQVAVAGGTWLVAWYGALNPQVSNADYDLYFVRSTDDGVTWSERAALNTNAATDTRLDSIVRIAGSAAGTWVAIWSSRDYVGGALGTDNDVLFARSTDHGVTWSAPAPLHAYAAGDTSSDGANDVATDGAGNWIATWESNHPLGGSGTDRDIRFVRSTDDGATWSAPALLDPGATSDTAVDSSSQVETDADGAWVAVWSSSLPPTGSDLAVTRSFDAGATWSPRFLLPSTNFYDQSPDLAVAQDRWVLAWRGMTNGIPTVRTARFSSSLDDGATWSTAVDLDPGPNDFGDPVTVRIAIDTLERIAAIWHAHDVEHPAGLEYDIFSVSAFGHPIPAVPGVGLAALAVLLLGAARGLVRRRRQRFDPR